MGCFAPLTAYQLITPKTNGKKEILFKRPTTRLHTTISLPCGQCIGCRLERSRQWAIRCMHEAECHNDNCFITLTYNDDNLPTNNSVNVEHYQHFMKRLRKHYHPQKIRFYHCGEYGGNDNQLGRPHYHACLFGHDFEDKELLKEENGQRYYTSEQLEKIWGKGHCVIGDVTFESAAYVARYIMKKINGNQSDAHYLNHDSIDYSTGEIQIKEKEYTTMSRRPGIGRPWLTKFKTDVYPSDEVIINGFPTKPPKFYDNQIELEQPELIKKLKEKRLKRALANKADYTPERLLVKETICNSRLKQLKRDKI